MRRHGNATRNAALKNGDLQTRKLSGRSGAWADLFPIFPEEPSFDMSAPVLT